MLTPKQVAEAYFDAWRTRDANAMRTILADDVHFEGPLGRADDADGVIAGFARLAAVPAEGPDVKRLWVDGNETLTWFEMHQEGVPSMTACNWLTAKDGKVAYIRIFYAIAQLQAIVQGRAKELLEPDAGE